MGSRGGHRWSVFDGVRTFPSSPEALMAEINTAIAASEYAHANSLLQSSASSSNTKNTGNPHHQYDTRLADEAYRAGCAALAVGKPDEALRSFRIAVSKCPPEKHSALAKLQSLISLASQQLQKPKPTPTSTSTST